jgi:hypothetical protein
MMQRRNFIKLMGITGAMMALPGSIVAASIAKYEGPLYIMIHAAGGWDPTHLCDPKGAITSELEEDGVTLKEGANPMNRYPATTIKKAGNISYAPNEGFDTFFDKYYEELLVINAINPQTNSHDGGTRSIWSGRLAEGYPSLAAVIAGVHAPASAMSYISEGGYDFTDGLVAPTRVGASDTLLELATPNFYYQDSNTQRKYYYNTPSAFAKIEAARLKRLEKLSTKQPLPHIKNAVDQLERSSTGANELKLLNAQLGALPQELVAENGGGALYRNGRIAMAAYRAGLTVSVSLSHGGFDTHNNHDASHVPRLRALLEGVDLIKQEADRQGMKDKVVIVMGSEFGRTPRYNSNNGKDHWQVTSMMMMGPSISGNRVLGETDHEHNIVEGKGFLPADINKALRKLASVDSSDAVKQYYPLNGESEISL